MRKDHRKGNRRAGLLVPAVLFITGSAFLFAGVSRGEMDVVLRKAINICLECIGIG